MLLLVVVDPNSVVRNNKLREDEACVNYTHENKKMYTISSIVAIPYTDTITRAYTTGRPEDKEIIGKPVP